MGVRNQQVEDRIERMQREFERTAVPVPSRRRDILEPRAVALEALVQDLLDDVGNSAVRWRLTDSK
ncbi:MAG: hypothetical protein WDN44_05140 [Sphingomonas sp.]